MATELERTVRAEGHRREARLRAVGGARGVVHTPPELARYVARIADEALQRELGLAGGLADPALVVLDPACGPGAFLAACLAVAGARPTAPRALIGLEIDPAAAQTADRVLGSAARAAGWPLSIRSADALASAALPRELDDGGVLLVVGNPPWSSRSASRGGAVIEALLEDFRRDADGRRLRERKLGVLSDDYVRFFRWSAELARQAPAGAVLALVTNSSFLDGPVHRGMRRALADWFDRIDVLDLGGSALLARTAGRDDNVFGVRPAVAVSLLRRGAMGRAPTRYARVRGSRADKLARMGDADAAAIPFRRIRPSAPSFLLVPRTAARSSAGWLSLADAFPFHREGVQTNRDAVVIDRDADALLGRLRAFARGGRRADLGPALRRLPHYDPARARRAVREALAGGVTPRRIAYRPFDDRWFLPVAPLCHRPRPDLLRAVDRSSLILLTVRKDRGDRPWSHAAATGVVPDSSYLSARSSCRTRAFPSHGPDGRPNVDAEATAALAARIGVPVRAEDLLCYALAILSAPAYRSALDSELRLDYPRLPLPPTPGAYRSLVEAGRGIAAALRRRGPPGSGEIHVGHHRLCPAPAHLLSACARLDELVGPLLASGG